MTSQSASAVFPKDSILRKYVRDLLSPDSKTRDGAYDRACKLDQASTFDQARTPSWRLEEEEAIGLLRVAATFDFPTPDSSVYWKDGFHTLLCLLWKSPYPSLVSHIEPAYRKMAIDRRRCSLLALAGILATRKSAEVFMSCVCEVGWPKVIYPRVTEELHNLLAFPEVMFPELLLGAGRLAGDVGVGILNAISTDTLKINDENQARLQSLAPFVSKSLKKLIMRAGKHQGKPGIAWRFSKKYHEIRYQTGVLLDLAGWISDASIKAQLREALTFTDPRLIAFATLSLLRLGERVQKQFLEAAAACHESRSLLYEGLRRIKLEDRFPQKWKTWDAFAAANMVEWLSYPSELGREPDELEKMAVLTQETPEGVVSLYVWRFKNQGDRTSYAATSGVYRLAGAPGPISGSETFSCFDTWDSLNVEGHAERSLETLSNWRTAWSKNKTKAERGQTKAETQAKPD